MPLLEIKDLSVRFGGLAAVRRLSLAVGRGEIVSIIGPNGAGKTTVFNAISGVHEPTEGEIRFGGRELVRELNWPVRVACILVGLATGLAAMLLAVDADRLWRAAIRRNMRVENEPFTWGEAAEDAVSYLRGELAVEPGFRGRWLVVSPQLGRELGEAGRRIDAARLREALELVVAAERELAPLARDPRWRLSISEERLEELRGARRYVRGAVFGGFAVGFLMGVAGAFAIWRRSRRTPEVAARGGLARTFQNIRLFREMTVLENVLVGVDGARADVDRTLRVRRDGTRSVPATLEAEELLRFVGLQGKANALAGSLAYGDQRRLEIARALATRPELVLLDEPAAGMNPAETRRLADLIRAIHGRGVTVLLIEHHMNVVMAISDRVAVLDYGSKIAEGTPAEVRSNTAVIEAYLGKE